MWQFLFALFRFWPNLIKFRFLIFSALSQMFISRPVGSRKISRFRGEKIIRLSPEERILERKQKKRYFIIYIEQIYIYTYIYLLVCFYFCLITKLLELICSNIFSYQNQGASTFHILSCLTIFAYINNIHNILEYTENENLKPQYFTQHHNCLTFFTSSRKKSTWSEVNKKTAITKVLLLFLPF